ncbi:MAG: alpha/beta hydrolase [Alphaproteobacteria bacterium]|nr:alpha/beta hydrolase [Alphaproteobacteria bacterium]
MPMTSEKFVDVGGIRTRYFEKGTGEPVVLFHGGNFGSNTSADSADDWDSNFDDLARRYRVFAIDKLGQGYTDNPKTDDDYTMHAVVQHAWQTLRVLGLEAVHLVGHSRGGYLTCKLTVEHPELVKTCTIVDSNTCAPGTGRNELVFQGIPEPRLSRESQRWVLETYSYNKKVVTESWLDALVKIANRPEYKAAVERMIGKGYTVTKFLPRLLADKEEMFRRIQAFGIQRPTLLIWGYNDPTATLEHSMGLYRIIAEKERRTRLHYFNECGHFSFREHPERFNEVLHNFIQNP